MFGRTAFVMAIFLALLALPARAQIAPGLPPAPLPVAAAPTGPLLPLAGWTEPDPATRARLKSEARALFEAHRG